MPGIDPCCAHCISLRENKRVEAEVLALKENRFKDFLNNITASGNSSWKWLQNCFTNSDYQEQGITVTLALTELFIAEKQKGPAGSTEEALPALSWQCCPMSWWTNSYTILKKMHRREGSAYRMSIRPYGAICFNDRI